jgi:hypothetical protein
MKKVLIICIVTSLVGVSCRRNEDQIPNIAVDIYLNINEPSNFNLSVVGGADTYTGGSNGIIVYRNSLSEFSAYDRHVPYNIEEYCQLQILDDGLILEDPCSGSQWIIVDGSLAQGPAVLSLQGYNTTFVDPLIHIWN